VCLHTHSRFSTENLASLNWVSRLSYMRPLKGVLQWSFGLGGVSDLDYSHLCYHPPFRPSDIWNLESANAARLGMERLLLTVTDHDEVTGAQELRRERPADAERIGLGEELTIRFQDHVFHLGLSGLPPDRVEEVHSSLQSSARQGRLDAVFEELESLGCLVVLNHPLIDWRRGATGAGSAPDLLRRYGRAIDALEINGMRPVEENRRVAELARQVGKPLVGGGDSHLLTASGALCASRAASYTDFVAEVKSGWSRPLVTREYFSPLRWKLTLRVLSFIAQYRRIAEFRGKPVETMLAGRWVALDPIGLAARWALAVAGRLAFLA
jgi:predicted metal-dependent phosphoesterase TrpH